MVDKIYKFGVTFIVMLLVLGLTLPACTYQEPTETGEPATLPEEQAEGELSFKAAEYANEVC